MDVLMSASWERIMEYCLLAITRGGSGKQLSVEFLNYQHALKESSPTQSRNESRKLEV